MQDLKTLMDIIDKMMEWMKANENANKSDYCKRYREVDSLSKPVLELCMRLVAKKKTMTLTISYDNQK